MCLEYTIAALQEAAAESATAVADPEDQAPRLRDNPNVGVSEDLVNDTELAEILAAP